MDDFKWYYSNFITQMYTSAYREIQKSDKNSQEKEAFLEKNDTKIQKILASLNEEDRTLLEKYIVKQSNNDVNCSENMYIAGYRDCVKLLRELGIM